MNLNPNDVIAVTIHFFTEVKGRQRDAQGKVNAPATYKHAIVNEIKSLMAGGHTTQQLMDLFERPHPKKDEVYTVKELFDLFGEQAQYGKVVDDPDNLLTFGTFYYHPTLQITSGPPRMKTDEEGNTVFVEEPFFLEMRPRLTIEDLHNILRPYFGWAPLSRKFQGAYEYLLKHHTVEELLFMADCARADMDTNGQSAPMSPLRLQDYEAEMYVAIDSRKNICFEGGLSHVIPRKRDDKDPVH